jgi:DcmR-like sensory protein
MSPVYPCTKSWLPAKGARHVAAFFDSHLDLVDAASDFFEGGLRAGCACICVTTDDHRAMILAELELRGFDIARAIAEGQFVPLDANSIVKRIVDAGVVRPDEFRRSLAATVVACERRFPYVVGFGEVVRILVDTGHVQAALDLEQLWSEIVKTHELQLYCAYSSAARDKLEDAHLAQVCAAHERILVS